MGSVTDVRATRETKAQKVERLKRSKNPWEAFEEIKAFARAGRASVLPEWANLYFKWWGIYTQGDGAGAIGGQGGEGKATEYFMMRIGLPNGLLRSSQLRKIADISTRYARSTADITVRQNIQLHWLTIESIPEIMEELAAEGLGPKGACGDVARNITGCPLAGVAADEIVDASPLAVEASRLLSGSNAFYNLPRKFKVSVTGCPVWCSYPEINDIGIIAIERPHRGLKEIGFSVRVGGGLSADPHLAVRLNAFIHRDQVLPVVRSIAEMFRDQDVLRENRERARLKHLFTQHHWTADRFLWELNNRLGFTLEPAAEEFPPRDGYRDHVGIHAQKQSDRFYVGAAVLRGRITPEQMRAAADLADRFATGELRTTNMQNLIIINVPGASVEALACELNAVGLHVNASPFWRGAIACTGSEFCKFAITETKSFARWVVEDLEDRIPGFDQPLKLNVAGCPNACGQHWIADIGLEGKKIKQHGEMVDAYYFCLGGAVGEFQRIARPIGFRCTAGEVPAAIERLLRAYLANRSANENLRAYFSRFSDDALRAQLAGYAIEAVVRDPSPGPVPHGVGD
ncbi:MAG TPA: nitrite/sulfite reductase [Candidatus Limnocylindria bacterium]|nr:nitrite/sulfite reductase [Candidatus Limnocylindria bacterium]